MTVRDLICADIEQALGRGRLQEIADSGWGCISTEPAGAQILAMLAAGGLEVVGRYLTRCDRRGVADSATIWAVISAMVDAPGFGSRYVLDYVPRIAKDDRGEEEPC